MNLWCHSWQTTLQKIYIKNSFSVTTKLMTGQRFLISYINKCIHTKCLYLRSEILSWGFYLFYRGSPSVREWLSDIKVVRIQITFMVIAI